MGSPLEPSGLELIVLASLVLSALAVMVALGQWRASRVTGWEALVLSLLALVPLVGWALSLLLVRRWARPKAQLDPA